MSFLCGVDASGGLVKISGSQDHSGSLLGRPPEKCSRRLPGKENVTHPADYPAIPLIIAIGIPLGPEAESPGWGPLSSSPLNRKGREKTKLAYCAIEKCLLSPQTDATEMTQTFHPCSVCESGI